MKQQLFKLSIILFIGFYLFSCVADEEEISIQDLLIGKWKTTSYTENGTVPSNFTNCDYERTVEFSDHDITFVDFMLNDITNNCDIDETSIFDYELISNDLFKVIRQNGIIIETKILALSPTELKIKSIMNGIVEETTFERILY